MDACRQVLAAVVVMQNALLVEAGTHRCVRSALADSVTSDVRPRQLGWLASTNDRMPSIPEVGLWPAYVHTLLLSSGSHVAVRMARACYERQIIGRRCLGANPSGGSALTTHTAQYIYTDKGFSGSVGSGSLASPNATASPAKSASHPTAYSD